MAGNWMDDRERMSRERDGRGLGDGRRAGGGEERSWDREDRPDAYAARRSGPDRDRVFGERESGASYGRAAPDGRGGSAVRQGAFGQGSRYGNTNDTAGGRFYGDDSRERIYREEYGYGSDDPPRSSTREAGYGGYPAERSRDPGKPLSGGTGGYDYAERGYGDGGRRDSRVDQFEDAGRGAGEFLHRTGEKVASWFSGGGEGRIHDPDYLDPNHGKRGLGPQGYKRSDERINEDAHERLTEDHWLDASNISLQVSSGEVTLSGTVESREAKHRAERLVENLSGVAHVQNNLRIAKGGSPTSSGSGYGDSVLGAQMQAADDAVSNGTGGSGGGQSSAGRKT